MLFWNGIYKTTPLYSTVYMLVSAYVVLFLQYTVQYVTSSFTQISMSLLDAGRVFGASRCYVFFHITLMLISKGMAMAVICAVSAAAALLIMNRAINRMQH